VQDLLALSEIFSNVAVQPQYPALTAVLLWRKHRG
jgi:hypothetical protein